MARYDEDLHENLFFQTLVGKHSALFSEAAENRWMICVPRFDTVARLKLNRTDFENHILKPVGSPEKLASVNNKYATVDGEIIRVGQGYKETREVKILFEECFFNSREESYQVFCVEQPLEGALSDDVAVISLENLDDCCKFLWTESGGEKVKKSVDRLLEFFQIERGTLRPIMDAASAVYTRAVQEVFKERKFQSASHRNFCKLAVETYVMAGLHKKIFKEVCFLVAHKDAEMNKITRNLSDTHPQYLGIKAQFRLSIRKAKNTLAELNQSITPLEKLYCFRRCIRTLTETPLEGTYEMLTADELLPILVYLVIVSDIPNWTGNLNFISKFHFSHVGMEEFSYYLTSFEAAVEYVRNEATQLASMSSPIGKNAVEKLRSSSTQDEGSPVKMFFKRVCEGDVVGVKMLLAQAQREVEDAKKQLCHPLCNCKKCAALEDRQLDDSDRVTAYSRDFDGRTGLHHAARMGHVEVVQLLLEEGAIVSATDYHSSIPLHLACQKGHLKCVLLLLGEGCSANVVDNANNTPLHLACSNGHEECVKALLFNKEHCEVNVVNDQGDTPLHNATRWGYASIVSVLLEHGASTKLPNKRNEIPSQCAQSRKVQELLSSARRRMSSQSREEVDSGERKVVSGTGRSRRASMRKRSETVGETDRQIKRLLRAIQDDDINKVRYLFGWNESTPGSESSGRALTPDLCHPLCQCDKCIHKRKNAGAGCLPVDCADSNGITPLHKAALLGNRMVVELLIRHGATIDSRTRDQLTPLHLACQYNHKDIVLTLMEHRAQVNPRDAQGNTPLHFACNNGHMESATILLIHGADVSVTNHRGDTPLHNAARWNHSILVNELILYGAQYTITNNDNKTPIDLTKDDDVKFVIRQAVRGKIEVGAYKKPLKGKGSPEKEGGWLVVGVNPATNSPIVIPRQAHEDLQVTPRGSPRTRVGSKSKDDEKLDAWLRAIEGFGRSSPLQRAVDDRSAPSPLHPIPIPAREWSLNSGDFSNL